jgi:hypothetical protein
MKVYVPAIVQLPTFVVVLDFAGEAAFHAQRRWQKGDMAGLRLTAPIDLQSNQDRSVEVVREAWRSLRSGLNPSAPPAGPRDPNLIG